MIEPEFDRSSGRERRELYECPNCDYDFVELVQGSQQLLGGRRGLTTWSMTLKCSNCGFLDKGVTANQAEFNRLNAHSKSLRKNFAESKDVRAEVQSMEGDIAVFEQALREDWILPEDF